MSNTPAPTRAELPYDAILVVSFGGPDGPNDVLPFLENVLRGRNVPRERMFEVADHYLHFGGKSPINDQNRALIAALEREFSTHGPHLPIYWGNRNWHPLLADTLARMRHDGVRRALAFVTSAFSSYSGCRQYREDIAVAQQTVGAGAPEVEKLRVFFNHPGFIEPMVEHTLAAFDEIPEQDRAQTLLVFSAHSIPRAMADGSLYEPQLREACRLVSEGAQWPNWQLAYQSRSGPPTQPWLEPDVGELIRAQHAARPLRHVVVVPIGFISDHLEVLFDLDTELRATCDELGVRLHRAATAGTHPRFVRMIRELVEERLSPSPERLALGRFGPKEDNCPADCCRYDPRRPVAGGGP